MELPWPRDPDSHQADILDVAEARAGASLSGSRLLVAEPLSVQRFLQQNEAEFNARQRVCSECPQNTSWREVCSPPPPAPSRGSRLMQL